ncbi:hypothetical protein DFQ30_001943, partial [Apophysomyces sp. BC1015]
MYFPDQSEQLDETASSVVYIPQSKISQDLPPIIVTIQSEINEEDIATNISEQTYCKFWAKSCFVLTPDSIQPFIDSDGPMNELVAFGYFLINYRKLVLSPTSSKNPTVQWLVEIARAKMKVRADSLERAA